MTLNNFTLKPTTYGWLEQKHQQNIQRAQGVVTVTYLGTQYAFVADHNYIFNDPHFGNGSQFGKQIGGKIGIVKDPFGAAVYLGATTPIVGGMIDKLSIGLDGKTLLGNVMLDEPAPPDSNYYSRTYQALLKWDVAALIEAAEFNQTLTIPFDLWNTSIHPQKFDGALPNKDFGWIYGLASGSQTRVTGATPVRYGDIGEIDLYAILKAKVPELADASRTDITGYMVDSSTQNGLQIVRGLFGGEKGGDIVSRQVNGTDTEASDQLFADNGILYVAANITDGTEDTVDMLKKLRNGERLDNTEGGFTVTATVNGQLRNFEINLTFADFGMADADGDGKNDSVFFGDRKLDNPGYSAFTLQGSVSTNNATNNPLDVWRVEQRLKYLGFPAMGAEDLDANCGLPSKTNNQIQNFEVDGKWERNESLAAYLFNKVIEYGPGGHRQLSQPAGRGAGKAATDSLAYFNELYAEADSFSITKDGTAQNAYTQTFNGTSTIDYTVSGTSGALLGYLNAYNAPHWMNIGAQMASQNGADQPNTTIPGWVNKQVGTTTTNVETYGTSWMRDLMLAGSTYAPHDLLTGWNKDLIGLPIERDSFWFNGGVDANHGATPFTHGTHDLGMAFDLGVSQYIDRDGAQKYKLEQLTLDTTMGIVGNHLNTTLFNPGGILPGGLPDTTTLYDHIPNKPAYWACEWDFDNAMYLSGLLPHEIDANGLINYQTYALRDALALYAVTRSATWSGVNIVSDKTAAEEASIRAALFGDGTQAGSLISQMIIGASSLNKYPNIHEVLMRLGIKSDLDAQHHFHVYLNPPDAVPIATTQNLLADVSLADVGASGVTLQTEAQGLLDYALTLTEGEELMFIMDIPNVPPQQAPIVLVQADTSGAGTTPQPDYILKYCKETESTGDARG